MMCETIAVIRPSLKKICADNSCQAAIFNHALYWIAKKCKEGCNYWYDTGENIYHALAETWGISIIRREINALVDSHLIGETNNPKWGADRTKHFYFGEEQATTLFHACEKHEVCLFCIGLPEDVLALIAPHLIDLTNAIIRFNKCICQNHQMQVIDLLNASDRSIKAITKISSKITYKEKDTREGVAASASPPSPSFSSDTESQSQQATASPPVTADTAITGQAGVIPIATSTTQITTVTQALESETPHDETTVLPAYTHPQLLPDGPADHESQQALGTHDADVTGSADRSDRGTLHSDTIEVIEGGIEPTGYMKGESDESSTGSIWDRDAGSATRDSDLLPPPERPFTRGPQEQAIQETQTAQVTQQTPLLQAMTPVLSGDASENSTPPQAAPLRLSHPFYEVDVFAEDTWIVLPGRATETIPVSLEKTVQTGGNKKPRGKAAKPEKPIVPTEPEPDPLTAGERELFDAWNSIFDAEVPLGPKTIEVVRWLNGPIHTWAGLLDLSLKQTLEDERRWCYANDSKGYYKKRGVRLYNLKDDFEGWQSMKQEELRKKREQEKSSSGGSGEPRKVGDYYFYQPETRRTREAAPIYPQVAASATSSIAYRS